MHLSSFWVSEKRLFQAIHVIVQKAIWNSTLFLVITQDFNRDKMLMLIQYVLN